MTTGMMRPTSFLVPEAEIARFGVETRTTEVNYAVGDSVMVSGKKNAPPKSGNS